VDKRLFGELEPIDTSARAVEGPQRDSRCSQPDDDNYRDSGEDQGAKSPESSSQCPIRERATIAPEMTLEPMPGSLAWAVEASMNSSDPMPLAVRSRSA
jgi:hypothetical protein